MSVMDHTPELRQLLHTLNNQLAIVLAQAELLTQKALDAESRTRAERVVNSVLDAMTTARQIRIQSSVRASEP